MAAASLSNHLHDLLLRSCVLHHSNANVLSHPPPGFGRDNLAFFVLDLFTRLQISGVEFKKNPEPLILEEGGGRGEDILNLSLPLFPLALGALDNSFLVGDSGVQVVKNYSHGIQGKGVYVNFDDGSYRSGGSSLARSTPRKALLMRAETNMLLMSPMKEGKPHTTGLHQFDIETGKVVTEWKFEKDGTDITMKDIANDSKGAQLDPSGSILGIG